MKASFPLALAFLCLSACGESADVGERGGAAPAPAGAAAGGPNGTAPSAGGESRPGYERPQSGSLLGETVTPVRVGELGPAFPACTGRGRTRERAGGGRVPVRAAPFEQAAEVDSVGPDARFFICSRSHDQRWTGIVYEAGGSAGQSCGVSGPSPERDYTGPCASGWVPSARIRLAAGPGSAADSTGDAGGGAEGGAPNP